PTRNTSSAAARGSSARSRKCNSKAWSPNAKTVCTVAAAHISGRRLRRQPAATKCKSGLRPGESNEMDDDGVLSADLLLTPEEISVEFSASAANNFTNNPRIRGSNESLVSDA